MIETIISEMKDNVCKIAALRGLIHSAYGRGIGAVRTHIRMAARANAEEAPTLDERNEFDNNARAEEELSRMNMSAITQREAPLTVAAHCKTVALWAQDELGTIAVTQYDTALDFKGMLNLMIDRPQPLEPSLAAALSQLVKIPVSTLNEMHMRQDALERSLLREMRTQIESEWNSIEVEDVEADVENLPVLFDHSLSVKIVQSLRSAKMNLINRAMRSRRIEILGDIPLLDDAIAQASESVLAFERDNKAVFHEAAEAGIVVPTL